ncbi:50S ribosomal protein L3 [Candidatus Gracilibacteria bacterium]|nr:50S ribosomal protein L3 [Candidatus Gracilibacteria bacterium]
MAGLLARKIEMTRVIKDDKFIPITLLTLPHMQVVGYKTQEKDGYSALIVGISSEAVSASDGKKTLSKNKFTTIREFPIDASLEGKKELGSLIGFDDLEGVEKITLSSISKGKGFAGAMKRHNFSGGPKTHGSKFHRALGSIGNRKPTRTHKGKKMHGHMGCERVTLSDVKIELVNRDAGIVGVRGAVPGARNSLVEIYFNN